MRKGAQPERAFELIEEMRWICLKPDVITYNAVTSVCGKGTQPEKALELLEEMRQKGHEPEHSPTAL